MIRTLNGGVRAGKTRDLGLQPLVHALGGMPLLIKAAFVLGKPSADIRQVRLDFRCAAGIRLFALAFLFGAQILINGIYAIALAGGDYLDGKIIL